MTTIELRTSVLAEIASMMDNEEMLKKALTVLRRLKKTEAVSPCCFTVEELKREIEIAEEEDRKGQYYSSDDLRKKHPLCQ